MRRLVLMLMIVSHSVFGLVMSISCNSTQSPIVINSGTVAEVVDCGCGAALPIVITTNATSSEAVIRNITITIRNSIAVFSHTSALMELKDINILWEGYSDTACDVRNHTRPLVEFRGINATGMLLPAVSGVTVTIRNCQFRQYWDGDLKAMPQLVTFANIIHLTNVLLVFQGLHAEWNVLRPEYAITDAVAFLAYVTGNIVTNVTVATIDGSRFRVTANITGLEMINYCCFEYGRGVTIIDSGSRWIMTNYGNTTWQSSLVFLIRVGHTNLSDVSVTITGSSFELSDLRTFAVLMRSVLYTYNRSIRNVDITVANSTLVATSSVVGSVSRSTYFVGSYGTVLLSQLTLTIVDVSQVAYMKPGRDGFETSLTPSFNVDIVNAQVAGFSTVDNFTIAMTRVSLTSHIGNGSVTSALTAGSVVLLNMFSVTTLLGCNKLSLTTNGTIRVVNSSVLATVSHVAIPEEPAFTAVVVCFSSAIAWLAETPTSAVTIAISESISTMVFDNSSIDFSTKNWNITNGAAIVSFAYPLYTETFFGRLTPFLLMVSETLMGQMFVAQKADSLNIRIEAATVRAVSARADARAIVFACPRLSNSVVTIRNVTSQFGVFFGYRADTVTKSVFVLDDLRGMLSPFANVMSLVQIEVSVTHSEFRYEVTEPPIAYPLLTAQPSSHACFNASNLTLNSNTFRGYPGSTTVMPSLAGTSQTEWHNSRLIVDCNNWWGSAEMAPLQLDRIGSGSAAVAALVGPLCNPLTGVGHRTSDAANIAAIIAVSAGAITAPLWSTGVGSVSGPALWLQRGFGMSSNVRQCQQGGSETDADLSILDSPTRIVLGEGLEGWHRGAIVGNILVALGASMALLSLDGIRFVNALVRKESVMPYFAVSELPGSALWTHSLVVQPLIASSIFLMFVGGIDTLIACIGLMAAVGPVALCFFVVWRWRHFLEPRWVRCTQAPLTSLHLCDGAVQVLDGLVQPRWRWRVLRPTSNVAADARVVLRRFGDTFCSSRGGMMFFWYVDVACTFLNGVVSGALSYRTSQVGNDVTGVCAWGPILVLVVDSAFLLVSLWLRPFASPFENSLFAWNGVLTIVMLAAAMAGSDPISSTVGFVQCIVCVAAELGAAVLLARKLRSCGEVVQTLLFRRRSIVPIGGDVKIVASVTQHEQPELVTDAALLVGQALSRGTAASRLADLVQLICRCNKRKE